MITYRSIFICLVGLLLLPACQVFRPPSSATPQNPILTPTSISVSVPTEAAPSPTPTPPPRQMTVCLAQEPPSLFWYEAVSPAARFVLVALYDGPFDRLNFNNLPVILEKVPAQQDGDVFLESIPVTPGSWIFDTAGNRVVLAEGVRYYPSGCTTVDCAASFSGVEAVPVDQLVIRFRLKSGLLWADGTPLTAGDSQYSYEVAQALQPSGWKDLLQATHTYLALDELSLEWRGLPGYRAGAYAEKFFTPLPRHAWSEIAPAGLGSAELSARNPLGWGAYQVEAWQTGVQIVLRRNPNYFRAGEGLPYFDQLIYRFVDASQFEAGSLQDGSCDWVDPALVTREQAAQMQSLETVRLVPQPAAAWEQLTLGIARRDGSPSLLAQSEVRRALSFCINRVKVARGAFGDLALPAYSFLPPGHPQALTAETAAFYDPQVGSQLLASAGWVDLDGDPATPRTSQGVPGIPDGTVLTLNYLVSPEADRQAAARQVQADLAGCGVGTVIATQPFSDYLAPGPDGPVFGRDFQMAQFAWPNAGEQLCALYLSSEIPGPYPEAPKGWGGGNASGYRSPEFDQACQAISASLPDSPQRAQALQQAQEIFVNDLPAIPLYWRMSLAAAKADLCMPGASNASDNALWDIESFYRGDPCPPE